MPSQFGGIPYNPQAEESAQVPPSRFGGIPYNPEASSEPGPNDIQWENRQTDEISTITGKPKTEFSPPAGYTAPDLSTYFKQMFVDDPQTKLEIYSKARFPDLSREDRQKRYRLLNGNVIFQGDDKKWYPETQNDFLSQAKKFVGSEALRPSNITTGAGAFVGGLPGAAAGGAVGEGVRKLVGSLAFDEPQTYQQNLIDVAVEGIVGGLSEGAANKLFVGIPNKRKMSKGKDLLPAVRNDLERGFITPEDHARAEVIKNLADSYNIKLAPHQLYDKESMTNIWKYLRKHPQTSNAVKQFDNELSDSIETATEGVIRDIAGPNRQGPFALGTDIQEASTKAITGAEQGRSEAVQALYDEALKLPGNPETMQGVISNIDQLIDATPDTKARGVLMNVRKSLMTDPPPMDQGAIQEIVSKVPDYPMKFDNTQSALINLKHRKNLSAADLEKIDKISADINRVISGGQSSKSLPGIYKTLDDINQSGALPDSVVNRIRKGIDADVKKLSAGTKAGGLKDYKGKLIDTDKLSTEYDRNLKKIAEMQTATKPDMDAMIKALDERGIPVMQQRAESPKGFNERIINDYKRIFKAEVPTKQVYGGGEPTGTATSDSIESALKSRGIKNDLALDSIDLFDDLADTGATVSPDGMVTLYHRTSKKNADKIIKTGKMFGKEDNLFFGTKPDGQISGYGDSVVKVKVPIERLQIDDVFENEAHLTLSSGKPGNVVKVDASGTAPPEIQSLIDRNDQIKNVLSEVSPGQDVAALMNDYKNAAIRNTEKIADTDLKRLQKARFEIDDLIDGVSYDAAKISPSSKKTLNSDLSAIKEQLTAAMDEPTGGLYTEANNKFAELSDPIDRMRKSVVGEVSRMQSDSQVSKLPRKFLSPAAMTDPDLLTEALTTISKDAPDLGNRIAGGYVRDIYESLKTTEGGNIANVAGKMHKALFGTKKQRDLMKAALQPQQYENLRDLMTVFRRAAIGSGSESMTAGFQAIERDLSKSAGGKLAQAGKAAFTPIQSAKEMIFDRWNDLIVRGNQERLLNALKSDQATRLISKMKPMDLRTQKGLRAAGTLLNLLIVKAGGQYVDRLTSDTYPIKQAPKE